MNASPFLFIVGCPRSGTTLLQRMLDHHPQLAVANDTHFIPRCVEKVEPACLERRDRSADPAMTRELRDAVAGYHRLHRLGLPADAVHLAAAGAQRYSDFVGRLYRLFAAQHGKRHGGEKTPDYVRRVPWLAACFPRTRFLHIVRDGRDVALSLLDWATSDKGPGRLAAWAEQPLATAASWWDWQVAAGLRAERALPADRLLRVHYERLVAQPHAEMDRVCTFLDLPMSERTLRFHVGRQRGVAGASAKRNWLPPTQGLRDWRAQMAPADVALFERLAGGTLQAAGYEPAGGTLDAAGSRLAVAHRRWWDEHLLRRQRKLRRRIERLNREKEGTA